MDCRIRGQETLCLGSTDALAELRFDSVNPRRHSCPLHVLMSSLSVLTSSDAHVRPTVVIDFSHYTGLCCIFEIQTIKPFVVPFIGHSRSSAMSSFVRSQ